MLDVFRVGAYCVSKTLQGSAQASCRKRSEVRESHVRAMREYEHGKTVPTPTLPWLAQLARGQFVMNLGDQTARRVQTAT